MEIRRKKEISLCFKWRGRAKTWKTDQKIWKMRGYRSNVRSDAARLEKMREKDRECKKTKRDLQRQAIKSGKTKLEKKDQDAKKHLDEKIEIKRKQITEKLRLKWRK